MNVLTINRLEKWFGSRRVLNDVNLEFEQGVNLVVGANGSGKSTLLSCIAQFHDDYKGHITLDNLCSKKDKMLYLRNISYSMDTLTFFPEVSTKELASFIRKQRLCCSLEEQDELIKAFGLQPFLIKPIKSLSLGTAKKAMHVAALIIKSNVLLLDEPLNGLDKNSQQFLISFLEQLKDHVIIIIATHRPQDFRSISTRLIDFHQVLNQDTAHLTEKHATPEKL